MQRKEWLVYSLSAGQSAAAAAQPASDNPFGSASGAAAAKGKKQISSVELTRECLNRLQRCDSSLPAYVEPGEQLAGLLNQKEGPAAAILANSANQKEKYEAAAMEIQTKAEGAEGLAAAGEDRLSSLSFISKKKMFPAMAMVAGLPGGAIAITGHFM
jgi:hypothetical protein